MNPGGSTGDPNTQNRPSVFSDLYPPPTRAPFDWGVIPGTSQSSGGYNALQNPGFNMQPQLGASGPNFQFGQTQRTMGHTVQFPFPRIHVPNIGRSFFSRVKRKTNSPPLQPAKQLITEEKMSEHMSKLHISSETETDMESEQVREQRLYVCEEMKKFQAQTESILPESLLSSISRPCTALVLWKPPSSILLPMYNQYDEESENNNNNSARDNNPVNVPVNEMEFDEL